jgi:predicted metal-dependent hydrolase
MAKLGPIPVVRRMRFPFATASIPKHWMWGSVLGTHLANSLNLIFPAGERFFVRAVRDHLDQIDDEELMSRVRAFFGQEGAHAHEHERFFSVLREQGFDIDAFLVPYQRIGYDWLEPHIAPVVRLSITAALEHFTASFAEDALTDPAFEQIEPTMRDLLRWHAAEEIEHKSVAYDVLMAVNPSYGLRMAGLGMATLLLGGWWFYGAIVLIRQDPAATAGRVATEYLRGLRERRMPGRRMARAMTSYVRRGFHPSMIPNDQLAADYLAGTGRLDG